MEAAFCATVFAETFATAISLKNENAMNRVKATTAMMVTANITAYTIYNAGTWMGTNHPNVLSWGLWSFIMILSSSSYYIMSGDRVKSILPILGCILCIITFLAALVHGTTYTFGIYDVAVLLIGIAACGFWLFTKSVTLTHFIVLGAVIIGYIPTWRAVWANPGDEATASWFLWATAYFLQGVVVRMRWKGKWEDAVYPIAGTILHLGVALLSLRG